MKSILMIIKKELSRIFTNKKLVAMLFVPGISIFFMYSFLGVMLDKMLEIDPNVTHTVYVSNYSDGLSDYFDTFADTEMGYRIEFIEIEEIEINDYKEKVFQNDIKVLIVLDDKSKEWFDTFDTVGGIIEVYYNGDSMDSLIMYSYISEVLQLIEQVENNVEKLFTVNTGNEEYNLAGVISVNPFTSMIPMLLLMFLFSGVMSNAVESIAGEKERGTLATILMTPLNRFKLAIGKVLALCIPATISALASFAGLILSLPKLTGDFELNISPSSYFYLGVIIVITVLLFVVLISLISTLSKSVKEATQLATPLMIINMISSLVLAFVTINSDIFYLIPVLNSTLAIKGALNSTFTLTQFSFVIISNLVFIILGVFVLGKMFNSEKVMFKK